MILLLVACTSPLPDPTSLVDAPRVLAVQVTPAEAEPGAALVFHTLYADATGPLLDGDVALAACLARKPLAETGPVATSCLDPDGDVLDPFGAGLDVTGTMPEDACSTFGPLPATEETDTAGGDPRPVDPDVTGGYYQPVMAFADDAVTLVSARVRCGLTNVDQDTYVAYNQGYHDNTAPEVAALTVDGSPAPTVDAGAELPLSVGWTSCPTTPTCGDGLCTVGEDLTSCPDDCNTPVGCAGAEGYLRYDNDVAELVTAREAISVTWFGTGGTFAEARGGRAADDEGTTVDGTWTAPPSAGTAWIWAVLRDDRGGVGVAGVPVTVR